MHCTFWRGCRLWIGPHRWQVEHLEILHVRILGPSNLLTPGPPTHWVAPKHGQVSMTCCFHLLVSLCALVEDWGKGVCNEKCAEKVKHVCQTRIILFISGLPIACPLGGWKHISAGSFCRFSTALGCPDLMSQTQKFEFAFWETFGTWAQSGFQKLGMLLNFSQIWASELGEVTQCGVAPPLWEQRGLATPLCAHLHLLLRNTNSKADTLQNIK